jgi:hypothetical protein
MGRIGRAAVVTTDWNDSSGWATLGEARTKTPFPPVLPKLVYCMTRPDAMRPIFAVEGVFDCGTLWQGSYQTVTTLGTWIKPQDVRMLAWIARIVFVPNNDEPPSPAGGKLWGVAWCSVCPMGWGT